MKLIDTIRSRTLAIRFGALPTDVMTTLLEREELPLDVLPFALGSLARARALASPEVRQVRQDFLDALDLALSHDHPQAALKFAEERPDGRGDLVELLAHVASAYALRSREGREPELHASRHQDLLVAIREIEANASPALVLESLVTKMMQHA